MTTQLVTLPTFATARPTGPVENELGAGIEASFGTLSCKGKVWTTKYKGEEKTIMRPDGDGPRNSIEVVIVRASKVKSKKYFAGGYVEGSGKRPDCKSGNGVTPDPDVLAKQSPVCATCPKNQFGSAPPRPDGTPSKGKACTDSKRISVVFADAAKDSTGELQNAMYGGPLLFQIPATSLAALQVYGERLSKIGHNAWEVITRMSFDPKEAFPRIVFEPARPLTDTEKAVTNEQRDSSQVHRMIAEDVYVEVEEAPIAFIAPPLPTSTHPPAKPALSVVPPTTPQVTQPVTPATTAAAPLPVDFEAELDALLKA